MLSIRVLQFCALLIGANAATINSGYMYFKNLDGWLKLHRVPATWGEARVTCLEEGGMLASPTSDAMIADMTALMNSQGSLPCPVFTGVHSINTVGNYYSIEGVPLTEMPVKWEIDTPRSTVIPTCKEQFNNCIALLGDGNIADEDCHNYLPYICYKTKDQASEDKSTCGPDAGYSMNNQTGSCYKFHPEGKNWSDASDICSQEGGYLAIINSNAEADVLKNLFAKYPANAIDSEFKNSAMLGFQQWHPGQGDWTTLFGEPLKDTGYTMWSPGQPDNAVDPAGNPGQACGGMFRSAKLDDLWCHIKLAFICEKSPVMDSEDTCAISAQ